MQQYISCEKFGGLYLAEPGLTAGRQAGWLTEKFEADSEKFKAC